MRALARKFGAHLTFRHGESTGTIDLAQQPQAELPKLSITASFEAVRAVAIDAAPTVAAAGSSLPVTTARDRRV